MEWEATLHSCSGSQGLSRSKLCFSYFSNCALDLSMPRHSDTVSPRARRFCGRSCHWPHFLLPGVFLLPALLRSHDRKPGSPTSRRLPPLSVSPGAPYAKSAGRARAMLCEQSGWRACAPPGAGSRMSASRKLRPAPPRARSALCAPCSVP